MRILLYGLGLCLLLCAALYGAMLWENNRDLPPPPPEEMVSALERGIQWLDGHQEQLLSQDNPMLWWMVQQSAAHTQDRRLQDLFSRYRQEVLGRAPSSPWQYLFSANVWLPIDKNVLRRLPDYNQHILYALSCDPELGSQPWIQQQLRADFCPEHHPVSPACTTHQLMGMYFMQQRNCGDAGQVDAVISTLLQRTERLLTWDPRLVDVYLQRVLMLVQAGQRERVRPAWLRRVLEIQRHDGGWSGFHPLLPLGSGRAFGFAAHSLTIRQPASNFHATAQGVLVLALLLEDSRRQN